MCAISEEFKTEGRVEENQDNILELLEELGEITGKLENKIMEQSNLLILKKWLKLAARATTIEEFLTHVEEYKNGTLK